MNLEVLFNAADLTGNDTLRQIAISHADKTMMNHIRPDGAPPRTALSPPFITKFPKARRSMSWSTMPRLALSLRSAQRRATPTRALGAAVKHGVFTALPTVSDRIHSR